MQVRNHTNNPIGLPNLPPIPVGGSIEVDAALWDTIRWHPIVSRWLEIRAISSDDTEASKAEVKEDSEPEKERTAVEVLAMADTVPFPTFKAAAAKILGDNTPSTKIEIIAALKPKW